MTFYMLLFDTICELKHLTLRKNIQMIKLDKIYTKGGDTGETSLADGTRIEKHAPRIHAQGEIDELNAAIGIARLSAQPDEEKILANVQNDLFDLGADLARPGFEGNDGHLRIQGHQVKRLENHIDVFNEKLEPLKSFILRGGTRFAASLHLACTICRRAERSITALSKKELVNPQILMYVNRLSDLFFVMARSANDSGSKDLLWEPGKNQ